MARGFRGASGSARGPAPGFLLMLLQLYLGIPPTLENAAGQGSPGMAVLRFPRVVVHARPDNRFTYRGLLPSFMTGFLCWGGWSRRVLVRSAPAGEGIPVAPSGIR